MKKAIYTLFAVVVVLNSCTEPIDLNLNTDENVRLVVDAHLTTAAKAHLVYLTETRDYFTHGAPITATGAMVTFSDGTTTETLIEDAPGHYYTSDTYAGEVGKTYTLTIEYNGKTHKAVSEILPVTPLLDVYYEDYIPDPGDDDEEVSVVEGPNGEEIFETQYEIYGVSLEPDTPGDHYLWFLNKNGERYTDKFDDWFFTNDNGVNGNEIDADFYDFFALPGDVIELEQMSITKEAHDYMFGVSSEIYRGGLFDGAPANVSTNLDNGALGFFITSDISTQSLTIQE